MHNQFASRTRLSSAILVALFTGMFSTVANSQTAARSEEPVALDEIVVTAQKIKQDIRAVPLAVSAIEGDVLDKTLTVNTQSLQFIAPSTTFGQSTSRRGTSLRIRGVGTASFSDAVEQSVGTVVDGVTMGRQAQGFVDLYDVDRIEVLRGPQGTLFGKGTSAGLINVLTRDPTDDFEARGELSYTDETQADIRTMVSGPLADGITARFAARYANAEGFTENVTKNVRVDGKEERGARAKLKIATSEDWNLLLSADWSKSDSDCCNILARNASDSYRNFFIRNGLNLNGRPSNTIEPGCYDVG